MKETSDNKEHKLMKKRPNLRRSKTKQEGTSTKPF